DSERVLRLRTLARKVSSFALAAWSICGSPMDKPRVTGLGCSAWMIWAAGTAPSPAMAKVVVSPAVMVNAAQMVIALIAESLTKLVMVVIPKKIAPLAFWMRRP